MFRHGVSMRIDSSNFLLASQMQTRPSAAVKTQPAAVFEPGAPVAKPAASGAQTPASPGFRRLGQQLDIKI